MSCPGFCVCRRINEAVHNDGLGFLERLKLHCIFQLSRLCCLTMDGDEPKDILAKLRRNEIAQAREAVVHDTLLCTIPWLGQHIVGTPRRTEVVSRRCLQGWSLWLYACVSASFNKPATSISLLGMTSMLPRRLSRGSSGTCEACFATLARKRRTAARFIHARKQGTKNKQFGRSSIMAPTVQWGIIH